jgi:hypothetical protein
MYPRVRERLPDIEDEVLEFYEEHQVRDGLGREQLQELGAELVALKEKAPRSPSERSALKKAIDALVK